MTSPALVVTTSEEETNRVGQAVGKVLQKGDIILLQGDLGTGKSVLARGVALGLGRDENRGVRSPTFALIHDYELTVPLRHADLYRIDRADEIDALGLFDEMSDSRVTLIEWGERLSDKDRKGAAIIALRDCGDSKREITITGPSRLTCIAQQFGTTKK